MYGLESAAAPERLEQLTCVSTAKSRLLASVSSGLRAPLDGIVGLAAILLLEDLPGHQREYIEKIVASARAGLALVDDVLDFTKLESGELALAPGELDLRELVHDVTEPFAVSAIAKGVEVSCYVDPTLAPSVVADAGRLRQVLRNLLDNAVRFTSRGEIEVSVRALVDRDDAQILRFSVADTGVGVDADARASIFRAFARNEPAEHGGNGLGLAIGSHLVARMGGSIEVTSEPGEGSTFSFQLTLPKGRPSDPPLRLLRGRRVLALTPSARLAVHLRTILASEGALVEVMDDPITAVHALREAGEDGHPFDAAVLDACGRGMSGLDVARWLARHPSCEQTRVVLLESLGRPEPADPSARVEAVVSKPVRAGRLVRAIARERAVSETRRASTRAASARRHVLVAEDHPVTRELVVGMLQALGCTADVAVDGLNALSAYDAGRYDLVLMDLQMPGMDGYQAAAEIRRREGTAPRTPIIALTMQAMESDRARALAAGMNDYLCKPIEVDALSRALERWMERRVRLAHTPPPTPRMGDAIDRAALEHLRREGSDGELVREVVTRFLRDLPGRLSDLRARVLRGDGAAASARALAQRSVLLGASRLAKLANEIETAAAASDLDRAVSIVELVEREADDVRVELERLLHHGEPLARAASVR